MADINKGAGNFWRDLLGGIANAAVPKTIYNRYTNSYAPRAVTGTRVAAGLAGQLGPLGSIAGLITGKVTDRRPAFKAWDQSLAADAAAWKNGTFQSGTPSGINPAALQGAGSSFMQGAMGGGFPMPQFQGNPFAYGNGNMPAMMSTNTPAIGQWGVNQFTGQPNRPAMGGTRTAGYQGVRDRGGGHTGEAARSIFEGMSDASRFNTNFDFSGMERNS